MNITQSFIALQSDHCNPSMSVCIVYNLADMLRIIICLLHFFEILRRVSPLHSRRWSRLWVFPDIDHDSPREKACVSFFHRFHRFLKLFFQSHFNLSLGCWRHNRRSHSC